MSRPCPRAHCGGTILPHAYDDGSVEHLCHLCTRDPDAAPPDVELVNPRTLAGYRAEPEITEEQWEAVLERIGGNPLAGQVLDGE